MSKSKVKLLKHSIKYLIIHGYSFNEIENSLELDSGDVNKHFEKITGEDPNILLKKSYIFKKLINSKL